jgi:HEAT repeat protein
MNLVLFLFFFFVMGLRDSAAQPSAASDLASRIAHPEAAVRLAAIDEVLAMYLAEDLDSRARKALVPEPAGLTRAQRAFAGAPFSVWPGSPAPELTAALLRALSDSDRQVRLDAAYTVGAIARPPLSSEDTTRLLVGLGHADAPTRAAAARVIGRLQVQQGGDALVTAMNDPDDDVRVGAMWALGELRFERGVQALTGFSTYYGRGALGLAALDALARIAHPSSAPFFREALLDRNSVVRRRAAEALGRAGDLRAIQPLEGVVTSDRDPQVRAAALFALHKLGRHSAAALASLLADRRAFAAARSYLVEIAEPALMVSRLSDPDARVRQGAADVLGLVGSREAIAALTALREDPDPDAREAAVRALQRLTLRGIATTS